MGRLVDGSRPYLFPSGFDGAGRSSSSRRLRRRQAGEVHRDDSARGVPCFRPPGESACPGRRPRCARGPCRRADPVPPRSRRRVRDVVPVHLRGLGRRRRARRGAAPLLRVAARGPRGRHASDPLALVAKPSALATSADGAGPRRVRIGRGAHRAHVRPVPGLASPYANGVCLALLARTVTAQDHWRRGLLLNGVPIAAFYALLLGSALLSPDVAAQLHDRAAVATLLLNSSYILSTCVFLVVGGTSSGRCASNSSRPEAWGATGSSGASPAAAWARSGWRITPGSIATSP